MVNHRIFILLFLFSAACAQPRIPLMEIDTLLFEESLSFDAKITVQNKIIQQIDGFKKHYTELQKRCNKCRGTIWLELCSDTSGMIDSVRISDVGNHIIDRLFLDAVEDQIPWDTTTNGPRKKVEAVLKFDSYNEKKMKIAFLSVVGTILTIPPVAFLLFSRIGNDETVIDNKIY